MAFVPQGIPLPDFSAWNSPTETTIRHTLPPSSLKQHQPQLSPEWPEVRPRPVFAAPATPSASTHAPLGLLNQRAVDGHDTSYGTPPRAAALASPSCTPPARAAETPLSAVPNPSVPGSMRRAPACPAAPSASALRANRSSTAKARAAQQQTQKLLSLIGGPCVLFDVEAPLACTRLPSGLSGLGAAAAAAAAAGAAPACARSDLFEYHERIGSGSFGEVWRVTRRSDGRSFALKREPVITLAGLNAIVNTMRRLHPPAPGSAAFPLRLSGASLYSEPEPAPVGAPAAATRLEARLAAVSGAAPAPAATGAASAVPTPALGAYDRSWLSSPFAPPFVTPTTTAAAGPVTAAGPALRCNPFDSPVPASATATATATVSAATPVRPPGMRGHPHTAAARDHMRLPLLPSRLRALPTLSSPQPGAPLLGPPPAQSPLVPPPWQASSAAAESLAVTPDAALDAARALVLTAPAMPSLDGVFALGSSSRGHSSARLPWLSDARPLPPPAPSFQQLSRGLARSASHTGALRMAASSSGFASARAGFQSPPAGPSAVALSPLQSTHTPESSWPQPSVAVANAGASLGAGAAAGAAAAVAAAAASVARSLSPRRRFRFQAHRSVLRHWSLWLDAEGALCTLTDLCTGTLRALLLGAARAGRFSEEAVWQALAHAAGGLAYIHAQGLVHRDVKPDNILFVVEPRERLPPERAADDANAPMCGGRAAAQWVDFHPRGEQCLACAEFLPASRACDDLDSDTDSARGDRGSAEPWVTPTAVGTLARTTAAMDDVTPPRPQQCPTRAHATPAAAAAAVAETAATAASTEANGCAPDDGSPFVLCTDASYLCDVTATSLAAAAAEGATANAAAVAAAAEALNCSRFSRGATGAVCDLSALFDSRTPVESPPPQRQLQTQVRPPHIVGGAYAGLVARVRDRGCSDAPVYRGHAPARPRDVSVAADADVGAADVGTAFCLSNCHPDVEVDAGADRTNAALVSQEPAEAETRGLFFSLNAQALKWRPSGDAPAGAGAGAGANTGRDESSSQVAQTLAPAPAHVCPRSAAGSTAAAAAAASTAALNAADRIVVAAAAYGPDSSPFGPASNTSMSLAAADFSFSRPPSSAFGALRPPCFAAPAAAAAGALPPFSLCAPLPETPPQATQRRRSVTQPQSLPSPLLPQPRLPQMSAQRFILPDSSALPSPVRAPARGQAFVPASSGLAPGDGSYDPCSPPSAAARAAAAATAAAADAMSPFALAGPRVGTTRASAAPLRAVPQTPARTPVRTPIRTPARIPETYSPVRASPRESPSPPSAAVASASVSPLPLPSSSSSSSSGARALPAHRFGPWQCPYARVRVIVADFGAAAPLRDNLTSGSSDEADGHFVAPEVLNRQWVARAHLPRAATQAAALAGVDAGGLTSAAGRAAAGCASVSAGAPVLVGQGPWSDVFSLGLTVLNLVTAASAQAAASVRAAAILEQQHQLEQHYQQEDEADGLRDAATPRRTAPVFLPLPTPAVLASLNATTADVDLSMLQQEHNSFAHSALPLPAPVLTVAVTPVFAPSFAAVAAPHLPLTRVLAAEAAVEAAAAAESTGGTTVATDGDRAGPASGPHTLGGPRGHGFASLRSPQRQPARPTASLYADVAQSRAASTGGPAGPSGQSCGWGAMSSELKALLELVLEPHLGFRPSAAAVHDICGGITGFIEA